MKCPVKIIRGSVAVLIGILSILAFGSALYPVQIFDFQFTALLQRMLVEFSVFAIILFAVMLFLTLLLGRVYCSTICPLGLFQELLTLIFRRKMAVQKNRPYKYFLATLVLGTLIGGTACLVRFIDPYTLFGSAASGAWLGLVLLVALAVLVWFKGRMFCANICPVGTALGLVSKHAFNQMYMEEDKCVSCGLCAAKCPTGSIDFKAKSIDNETCIKCFRCLGVCKRNGIRFGSALQKPVKFNPSRRKLLIGGAAMAVLALSIKGGITLSKSIAAKVKKVILPAGAESVGSFANKCLNCNLCVQNCPMKIIKKSNGDYPTVHIDYQDSFCDYDCHRCSEVCPSGAIRKLSLAQKQKTQIGLAEIDESKCIKCGLCVMKCPREAISKEDGGFPLVNSDMCIGCGACHSACPVKAISIAAVEYQRML